MNNPLGVSPSNGKQGVTRGKEKYFDLGGNRTHDLRIRSTVNPEVVGSIPTEVKIFFFTSCGSLIPFTRANGSISTLIYTSELILCSAICVYSTTRRNIHICTLTF